MIEALAEPITSILDSVVGVVERTPPALVGDILEQGGITMTGGGSLLRGLDQLIEKVTGIPTRVADQPVKAAVLGAGRLLRDLNGMPEGRIDIPIPTATIPVLTVTAGTIPVPTVATVTTATTAAAETAGAAGITTGTTVTATAMAAAGGSKAVKTGMYCI